MEIPEEANHKRVSARRVVITSFLVDILDVASSLFVAVLSGSVIMVAQVLQGAADLVSSGFLILGVSRSKRPADKNYPFGYGRELYFWTMVSALVTFSVTSSLSIYLGWQRFLHPEPIHDLFLAYLVLVVTAGTNGYSFSLSLSRMFDGQKLSRVSQVFMNSPLIETKTTLILDLMGTVASILGFFSLVLYGISGDLRLDGLGAILIGITLAIFALFLLKTVKDYLIGKSASPEIEARIRNAALSVAKVNSVLDLKTIHLSPEKFLVNLEVNLADDMDTDEIEVIVDEIKAHVQSEVRGIEHIQVELETPG